MQVMRSVQLLIPHTKSQSALEISCSFETANPRLSTQADLLPRIYDTHLALDVRVSPFP